MTGLWQSQSEDGPCEGPINACEICQLFGGGLVESSAPPTIGWRVQRRVTNPVASQIQGVLFAAYNILECCGRIVLR